jgi:hypothetical protein
MNLNNNLDFKKLSQESRKDIENLAKNSSEKIVKQAIEYRALGSDY